MACPRTGPSCAGSAQNPDVFFQAREASNPFYAAVPGIVQAKLDELAARTGRRYRLFDYAGAPDAERVVVLMGSAAGAVAEAVEALCAAGEKVGLVKVRLYRPFPAEALAAALPADGPPDRRAGPDQGAGRGRRAALPGRGTGPGRAGGGRRPAHAAGHRRPLRPGLQGVHPGDGRGGLRRAGQAEPPRNHFTVGIVDDVTRPAWP